MHRGLSGALSISFAALLTACGGTQLPIGAPGAMTIEVRQ